LIKNNLKIFISATEQSGDNIGYNVIKEILKANDKIIFEGVGGEKMSIYLNKQFFSLKDFNIMGIFEVLFSIRKFIKKIKYLANIIKNNNYDLVITIDSPDFNYPLVKEIKKNKYNKNIIHIVAPTVWAWREYRAKNFAKIYNELLVLFDFEIKYFVKHGLKTNLIGHPIYYIEKNKNYFKKNKNIAFLPGSRLSELDKLFPYFQNAYEYLLKINPNTIIFIPTLEHLKPKIVALTKSWKLKIIISTNSLEIEKNYSDCSKALVCSGTASLEIAKRNIPQLIIYKLNFFTELVAKNFIKVKYANILNILENELIIPEITNSNLNNVTFEKGFKKLINDNKSNEEQINKINKILKNIETKYPPFYLAAMRILANLN
tara:strand:+ start:572 stop:1696 length:1125 start_codon:yes stop_codon:yes gene_type:complete